MAGERKGKLYEATLVAALGQMKKEGSIAGNVFWNETPQGMTIEPDVTIGRNVNLPKTLFLVTHSGSAAESHKKLWRNIGELVEAKSYLKTKPHVINILFDAIVKDTLIKVQRAAFDGQLVVGHRPYGNSLQEWVEANSSSAPVEQNAKLKYVLDAVAPQSTCKPFKKAFSSFRRDLTKLLTSSKSPTKSLWNLHRRHSKSPAPATRITWVRRGLGKLLIFEDALSAISFYRGDRFPVDQLPQYAFSLGLARKSIGGASPSDSQVANAVSLLEDDQILKVLASAPIDKINGWLKTLRNLDHLDAMGQYVIKERQQLCNPAVLGSRLLSLHANADAIRPPGNVPSTWPPLTVWLLEYIVALCKAKANSVNAFGTAQIAREVSQYSGMPPAADPVYRIAFPAWIHRREPVPLTRKMVQNIGRVLARHLSSITSKQLKALVLKIPDEMATAIINSKLLTYQGFDPLHQLIIERVPNAQIENIRTCFAEGAGVGGNAGKTRVLRTRKTIVNWQSATEAGRDHKCKELCGRAVGLRYSWDVSKKKYVHRTNVEKLYLVVDGDWRQEELAELALSGWDRIFFPDEIDMLAKAIV